MGRNEKVDETVVGAENTEHEGHDDSPDFKEMLKGVIKVKTADAGVLRKTLTISVPRESLQTEFDKEYKELITDSVIPGFRKGRAPRRLIEKRFARDVSSQVQTRVVSNAYLAAVEKEDLKVLGDPLLWANIKKKDEKDGKEQLLEMHHALPFIAIPDNGDFEFRCEVELKPQFELPSLEGIPVEKPKLSISDADVQAQIDRIRARRGNWAPTADGATVEPDDLLICDMKMTVDGQEVKKADNARYAARAQMIEGAVISDFGEKLAGAKVGETRTVEGELPDDYGSADYRGKKATFELTVQEIKRLQLPPLDASFLESMGFDSEDEFKTYVKSQMESQLDEELKRGMREQVRQYLLDNIKIDLPEGLSSRQTERTAARRAVELQRQGVPLAEIEKHADELRTSAQEEAARELRLFFILEEIAEKLEVEVSEEEINGQIASIARSYNRRFDRVRDELARNNGITMLYLEIRDDKCIDKLIESAKVTETEVDTSKKPAAKADKAPAKKAAESKAEAKKPAKAESKKTKEEPAAEKAPKAAKKSAESAEAGGKSSKTTKKTPKKKS